MLIVCPTCATSYDVDLASLQPNGRKVRCVRCRTIWHADSGRAEKLLAAAGAIAPDPGAPQNASGSFAEELVGDSAAQHSATAETGRASGDQSLSPPEAAPDSAGGAAEAGAVAEPPGG